MTDPSPATRFFFLFLAADAEARVFLGGAAFLREEAGAREAEEMVDDRRV